MGALLDTFLDTFLGSFVGAFLGAFLGAFVGAFVGAFLDTFLGAFLDTFLGAFSGAFLDDFLDDFLTNLVKDLRTLRFVVSASFLFSTSRCKSSSVDPSLVALSLESFSLFFCIIYTLYFIYAPVHRLVHIDINHSLKEMYILYVNVYKVYKVGKHQ